MEPEKGLGTTRAPLLFKWPVLLLAAGLTGCDDVNDMLIGDNAPVWLALSLFLAAMPGGLAMFVSFLRKFDGYDLGSGGKPPSGFSLAGGLLLAILGVAALGFTFYNWFSDIGIPPGQQWTNIAAWWAGAALGGTGAYLLGRELAFRRHDSAAAAEHRAIQPTHTEDR